MRTPEWLPRLQNDTTFYSQTTMVCCKDNLWTNLTWLNTSLTVMTGHDTLFLHLLFHQPRCAWIGQSIWSITESWSEWWCGIECDRSLTGWDNQWECSDVRLSSVTSRCLIIWDVRGRTGMYHHRSHTVAPPWQNMTARLWFTDTAIYIQLPSATFNAVGHSAYNVRKYSLLDGKLFCK